MAWKNAAGRLTGLLSRPAGHRSERPEPGSGQRPSAGAGSRKELPLEYDEDAREVIQAVRPWTMTSHRKLFGLILAARYVATHEITGDVVECGVWRGGSMQAVARVLLAGGVSDRDLHLFDTFEGMPPPSGLDVRRDGTPAQDLLDARDRGSRVWAVATLDDVRTGMANVGYPIDRIHFHKGLVQDTIPAQAPRQIALLRLDTDWYESTKHELEHLYDRLSPGGVLILDDYGHWEGARRAVDEFLAKTGARLLLMPMSSGRIAVKPGLAG